MTQLTYRMRSFAKSALAMALLTLLSPVALAHHSFSATFQADARIAREGVVTKYVFRNPHVLIYFDVTNEDGSKTTWIGEGPSAVTLRRVGWAADTVKLDDTLRISGDSTHDGSPMISLDGVYRLDPITNQLIDTIKPTIAESGINPTRVRGKSEYHELPLTLDDGVTPNFEAIWAYSLPAKTAGGRVPALPYSEAGAARKAAFDIRHDPQVFCDLPGVFRLIFQSPYPVAFTQQDDVIIIDHEEYAARRIIPLSDAPVPTEIKTRMGTSAARYEGDELIIETINFLENPATIHGDVISDQARIIERYRRDDDEAVGAVIDITMTVYDPLYLTEPVTVSRRKSILEGYEYTPHSCEPPLREREFVSPHMTLFAVDNLPRNAAHNDANCQRLAAQVGQDGKGWASALAGTVPDGVYYDAKGSYVKGKITYVTHDGQDIPQLSASQRLCYAASVPTMQEVKGAANLDDVTKHGEDGSRWLYLLGLAGLLGLGVFIWRRRS